MGCTSSTEAAPVGASKSIPTDTNDVKKREKSPTAGTEAMTTNHEVDPDKTTSTNGTTTTPSAPVQVPDQGDWSTVASNASTLTIPPYKIRYAAISKKGRDPDDKSKPNQDRYGVHHSFASSNAAFFGVYDGHGPHGDGCAKYVQERLPKLAQDHIEHQSFGSDYASIDQIRASLHMAHTEVNDELRLSKINDSYSGTTAVTLFVHESRITVCNVGDSRAILGTKKAGMDDALVSVPLSKDQTPHRPDEAARCKRSGARILSFGQINGDDDPEVEDPPRVWAKNGHYPGTAFTRSIGDAVAEKLGVFAEPEMLTVKISQNEKLIVLASDGIFDVMSNQDVVDLCFEHRDDPLKAGNAVIEKSHEEWLLNEECTDEESASYDDMTVVCVFIDDASEAATSNSTSDQQLPAPTPGKKQHHGRRVRQKTLRNLEEMEEG